MRVAVWAAAVVVGVAIAAPARAQNFSTALGGPPPSAMQFKPVDMSNLIVAPAMPAQQGRFNFSTMIRKLTSFGTPTRGVSPLPSPSSFPTYQSWKMIGTPPYQLGDPKAAKHPFTPVMPILDAKASGQ
jgi:hypothetical protein